MQSGDRNPYDKYVYMKELYKPRILIPVLSKSVEKWGKLWAFEYLWKRPFCRLFDVTQPN